MAYNQAAWFVAKSQPFEIRPADVPVPHDDEIIIKNRAVSINPVDWKTQDGHFLPNLSLPTVIGTDVAGEVHNVGSAVKGFAKGDRVVAHATCIRYQEPRAGAFQLYTAVKAIVTSKIPAQTAFVDAVVLPSVISTAAVGLYRADFLALPPPSAPPQPLKKAILVWGGSSSVGATAVQLARASGVTVLATTSARNLDAVRSVVGADAVFDYRAGDVVESIVGAVVKLREEGLEFLGVYDAISLPESFGIIGRVFESLKLGKKMLVTVLPASGLADDIEERKVIAVSLVGEDGDVAEKVWGRFLYEGLEKGVLKTLPPPVVVGKGLEAVQKGLDMNKEGVSYSKVVIEL